MIIREFNINDYDSLIELWTKAQLPFKPKGRDRVERIKKEINGNTSIFLVAEIEDKIVGSIFGSHDGRKGWINRLAVLPEYQNQGIATKLIKETEKRLSDIGIDIVACLIENWNDKSMKFFESKGYVKHTDIAYYTKRKNVDV